MPSLPARVLLVLALCALAACAYWYRAARPVALPAAADRLACASYAPFYRDGYTPFEDRALTIEQIDADLARLAQRFDCVRTYEVGHGLHHVAALAPRHGLRVLMGVWIGRVAAQNDAEIELAIATARAHPQALRGIVVGNEVLLRNEQTPRGLRAYLDTVRMALPAVPVTYADVWEFWGRHADLADAVSFVTVHILPYWEDQPVRVEQAVDHVLSIYAQVRERFTGKPVLLGETGWPSYGRQRQGALPSRVNQAAFIRGVTVAATQAGIPYNVIEAYDQHWKRRQEGAVGGYWGLYDAEGAEKFPFRGPVAEAPGWTLIATGVALAWFAAFMIGLRPRGPQAITALALVALAGGGAHTAYARDLWLATRDVGEALVGAGAALALIALTWALARSIAAWCAGRADGADGWLAPLRALFLAGAALVAVLLVVDPRYRDFPIGLYAVPAIGSALLAWTGLLRGGRRPERAIALLLAVAALWNAVREHLVISEHATTWTWAVDANFSALAWCALCLVFSASVLLPRAATPRC